MKEPLIVALGVGAGRCHKVIGDSFDGYIEYRKAV